MSVERHMLCGSFGTQNTMVAFIFRYDPRKGQYKVKLGQKGQILKVKIFFQKHAYVVQLCLRIPEMLFIFTYDN